MSPSLALPGSALDPKSFHVLAALAEAPSHGYAIRQQVEELTAGAVRLWPASLYGTLADLANRGWIAETDSPVGADDDPRRRTYRITAAGRDALAAEAARLEALAELARRRLAESR